MATENNQDHFVIVNAPSKFDLMTSLMQGDSSSRNSVAFKLKDSDAEIVLHVVVSSLAREDGSGDNWLFEGYVERPGLCRRIGASLRLEDFVIKTKYVHGYYNIVRRQGWMKEALSNA
jgi:hypothetical protein